jgi:intracellular sulfur oxidation DsrE/DsrF family protein
MPASAPRRDFLARLAAAAAAVPLAAASQACAKAAAGAPGSPPASTPPTPRRVAAEAPRFDDSWTARVRAARHKAVFDAPEVRDGTPLFQAVVYRQGYKQALGVDPAEVVPVVVLRHTATVLVLDDAVWAKYPVARFADVRAPGAKKKAPFPTVNPYSRPHAPAEQEYAEYMLSGLLASGVVVLACDRAFQGITAALASRVGAPVDAVRADARAGLMPGVILQPSGVYATLRAQEAGCTFMRS